MLVSGGGRHRPRSLPRHGPRSRHRLAGADGLRRGRRRDRGSRGPHARRRSSRRPSIPTPACSRSRPAGWPTTWASPASRRRRPRRSCTALAKVFLDKDCSLAEINPLVVTPTGDVLALDAKMTFDDNALFRHPDIEKLPRRDGGGPGRVAGGQVGPELHQPDRQHRLPGQRGRPGHEHDGHHQVSRRRPGQLPRRGRRRQQGAGDRGVPHPARRSSASRRCW